MKDKDTKQDETRPSAADDRDAECETTERRQISTVPVQELGERQLSLLARQARVTALQNVVSSVDVQQHDTTPMVDDARMTPSAPGKVPTTTPPVPDKFAVDFTASNSADSSDKAEDGIKTKSESTARTKSDEIMGELHSPPALSMGPHHREPGAYRYSPAHPPRRMQGENTGYQGSSQSLDASAYNSSNSLHATENKRQEPVLLEATLVESNREDDVTTIPGQRPPEPVHATTTTLVEAKDVNIDNDDVVGIRKKSLLIAGVVFLLLLIGVGVVVGVIVGKGNGDDNEVFSPSIAPSSTNPSLTKFPTISTAAIESFRASLPVYTQTSLEDATSAQSKAWLWLLDNADLDRYSSLRLTQRFVLATLYFSANGEQWNDNDGWLSDVDECNWSTDVFDSCTGQVYQYLILPERNLIGTLPPEIGMLTLLVELDLGTNQLQSGIPTEIAFLSNLEALWLYGNRFDGMIPTELGTMSQLFILDLESNDLSNTIPAHLSKLALLTELWLNRNRLSGLFPEWVSTLENLEVLYLSDNRIKGQVPASLSNLSELRELDLEALQLTGMFPGELWGSFTEISYFYISENRLQGNIGSAIGLLTSASVFELYTNDFNGPIPIEIGLMQNVSYVDLSDNFLTGDIPSELALLENLETLYLFDNLFSGSVPEQLCARVTNNGLDLAVDCDSVQCGCACNCLYSSG